MSGKKIQIVILFLFCIYFHHSLAIIAILADMTASCLLYLIY